MSKFRTLYATHFPTGDKGSVSVPSFHFSSCIHDGFSFHVGYFWGLVLWHCRYGKIYCSAYDLRVPSSRHDFCQLYNGRHFSALVTGRKSALLLV